MSTVLDLDVASLALTDGALWGGAGPWTVVPSPYGPVVGQHADGHAVVRLTFGDSAPAVVTAAHDALTAYTVHVVARIVGATSGNAPTVDLGGGSLMITPEGGWSLYGGPETDAVSHLHVVTVTGDAGQADLYLDGVHVGATAPIALGQDDLALVTLGGPGHSWDLARLIVLDEIPATLADDIADLVEQYVVAVSEVSGAGAWGIDGTVALEVGALYEPPPLPLARKGGHPQPPAVLPAPVVPELGDPSVVWRRSEVMPAPDLDEKGWPAQWEPTEVVEEPWGSLQILVGDVDVTRWRGVQTPFPTWSRTEPFGCSEATLVFPQLSSFEGDPEWCEPGAWVTIRWRLADGTLASAWMGVVDKFGHLEDSGEYAVMCRGPVLVSDLQLRQPAFDPAPRDVGSVIAEVLNSAPSRRTDWCSPVVTGISTSVAGGWEPRAQGYIQQLLATAVTGSRQWTVKCESRTPVIALKDTKTVQWTVRNGQRGVRVDLAQDWAQATNVLYGEGVSPDGGRWRNALYPGWHPDETPDYPGDLDHGFTVGTTDAGTSTGTGVSDWQREARQPITGRFSQDDRSRAFEIQKAAGITQDGLVGPQTWAATFGTGTNVGTLEAMFMPLAWAGEVMPRRFEADGTDVGPNPAYDADVLRVEDKIDFGQGVTKAEGKRAAREQLARTMDPGWSGTITLTLDPNEGSRYEIREGHNVHVRSFRGGSIVAHVTLVEYSADAVTLTVDTNARDYPTLDAIRDRDRNATDPAKAVIRRLQKGTVTDARATFDAESPAGHLPRHALFPGLWSVVPVPFARYGQIVRSEVTTSDAAAAFAVAVFNQPVDAAQLVSLVGNPLTAPENPWDEHADALAEAGLVMAWGWRQQPCGYYPKSYSTPTGPGAAPITGRMLDDSSWEYATERSPWMWVATIASAGCWVRGRFWPGAD